MAVTVVTNAAVAASMAAVSASNAAMAVNMAALQSLRMAQNQTASVGDTAAWADLNAGQKAATIGGAVACLLMIVVLVAMLVDMLRH